MVAFSRSSANALLAELMFGVSCSFSYAPTAFATEGTHFMLPPAEAIGIAEAVATPTAAPQGETPSTQGEIGSRNADAGSREGVIGNGWSLPINGRLGAEAPKLASKPIARRLDASIAADDQESLLSSRIDELLDAALERDEQGQKVQSAVTHFRKPSQRAIAQAKDTTECFIPFRGFAHSSEAGDVILNEKVKLKSRASAEYARQKLVDEKHLQVVSSMMQIAMGLGMPDTARGAEVTAKGVQALSGIVGEEQALETVETLRTITSQANIPVSAFNRPHWDVSEKQEKLRAVVESSLLEDPVLHQITKQIHKYNHRSKAMMATSRIVQTTLGVASLTPTFIGPAAKVALVGFVMATGGPEQCKLLKELYLDKRLESRCKTISEEAHLALDNYQMGLMTHNPALVACSQSIVTQLTTPEKAEEVLGTYADARSISTSTDSSLQ